MVAHRAPGSPGRRHRPGLTLPSPPTIAVVLAGALAGGFVTGLAAFGTGLVALGFWLHVATPATAANLVAICAAVGQAQTLPAVWHAVDLRRLWPLAAGLIGVPIGSAVLSYVDLRLFRLSIGVFLIAFAAYSLLAAGRWRLTRAGRPADIAVCLAGGVLAGLAGLSGPLPAAWSTLRGWPKDERRALLQVFNLSVLAFTVLWHAATGLITRSDLIFAAIALPGTLLGAHLGVRAYRRLSDRRFTEIILALLALSGLSLVLAAL